MLIRFELLNSDRLTLKSFFLLTNITLSLSDFLLATLSKVCKAYLFRHLQKRHHLILPFQHTHSQTYI
jgi:hypothetical protein